MSKTTKLFSILLILFLTLTKNLLSEPVNIGVFISLWTIIIYMLSIFYGLFLIFAGFNS